MNESKPNSGWNESKPSFSTGMNVDDAMEAAAEFIVDPMLFAETVAVVLADEVERLRAELELSKANVQSLKKALFEVQEAAIRLGDQVGDAREELAAAKAASACPVDIVCVYQSGWGQYASAELKSEEDAVTLMKWLRDRVKERSEG